MLAKVRLQKATFLTVISKPNLNILIYPHRNKRNTELIMQLSFLSFKKKFKKSVALIYMSRFVWSVDKVSD